MSKKHYATALKEQVAELEAKVEDLTKANATRKRTTEEVTAQRNEALAEVKKLKQRVAEAEEKCSAERAELTEQLGTINDCMLRDFDKRKALETELTRTTRELQQAKSENLHLEQRTAAAERIAQGERRWRKFYGRLAAGFAILLVAAAVAVGVSLKHDPNPRHNFEYRQ